MDRTAQPKVKIDLLDRLRMPILDKKVLSVNVRRYFTDVNGTLVDKSTVPAALQDKYPLYVFGEFDRKGAYFIGNRITPPQAGYVFYATCTWGVTSPLFFGFTGISDIQTRIQNGDIVTVYTDSILAPNYFIWVVQSTSRTGKASLASILENAHTHDPNDRFGYSLINIERMYYYTDNELQWNSTDSPIYSMHTDALGNYKHDQQDPAAFKTTFTQQQTFVDMKLMFPLNQYVGLYTYFLFDTENIDLNFKIKY